MIKVLLASTFILLTTTVNVNADPRHGYRSGYYHGHYHGHHYGHYRHRRNYAPYIAGAVALGVLSALTYDYYGSRCFNKIVGYDQDGDPIVRKICE